MAPRKEKSEKSGAAEQGSALIVEYLKQQNRPYSAIEISANLHNKVTKTYAVKALKELHDSNVIAGKAFGKQTVYHALQDPKDAISGEELVAMDKQIQELRESIATAKANEKSLKASLIAVNATMSIGDFRTSVIALESEKKELLARLDPLRAGTIKPVSTEEKYEVERAWREWSRKATVRRKICMELWDFCTEEMQEGKTREDLWDELGLEDDAD